MGAAVMFLFARGIKKVYDIKEVLGSGTFATVKKGIHKKTGENVAIKIIDKANLGDMEESLKTEVDVMKSVSHPNIICLKDIFETSDKLYLVLELVTGGELFDRIVAKGSYSEKEASNLIARVLEALQYLHQKGIVHRDLKPENLLYASPAEDASIKLADFGLAKMIGGGGGGGGGQVMHTTCGTPGYVAPEVLKSEGYGELVDVWSMGVILYILLCGFPPFHDDNQALLFEQIKHGRYDFPDPYWTKITPSAKDLVTRMMTVDPSKRITVKGALEHPWISGEEASAKPIEGLVDAMKSYNSKRRFRQAALGIMATHKMERLLGATKKAAAASANDSDED
eukprot:JP435763.1.p1 GENE.JP435763.1~~JP435763.1.p1  ORF type:complete len:340 (+),score=101.43 JP435763.1:1-1020(+)